MVFGFLLRILLILNKIIFVCHFIISGWNINIHVDVQTHCFFFLDK